MLETWTNRDNAAIDPTLHAWHGEVAGDLFLAAIVAGIMVLTGIFALREGPDRRSRALRLVPWLLPVLISLCLLLLWLDLANKVNAFRFYLVFRPQTPMSWGSWIILAVYPVSALFALSEMPVDLRERFGKAFGFIPRLAAWADGRSRGLARASVLLGTALGLYTGVVLSIYPARPLWNSALLPLVFLSSGLACASACFLLTRLSDAERRICGRLNATFLGAHLVLLALWLVDLAVGDASRHHAVELLMGGSYTAAFWTLVVALGIAVPLTGELLIRSRRTLPGPATAFFILVGAFSLRWILIYAGQHAGVLSAMH